MQWFLGQLELTMTTHSQGGSKPSMSQEMPSTGGSTVTSLHGDITQASEYDQE